MAATLANMGTNPVTGTDVFDFQFIKYVLTVMFTCGRYDLLSITTVITLFECFSNETTAIASFPDQDIVVTQVMGRDPGRDPGPAADALVASSLASPC